MIINSIRNSLVIQIPFTTKAPYTDPHTKLRFSSVDEYARLRQLPADIVSSLLNLRGSNPALV